MSTANAPLAHPHRYVPAGANAYTNVVGCIQFVGFNRCGLAENDPIHDEAARKALAPAQPDPESPLWPATGIPAPSFPVHPRHHGGPAPELGMQLHGQAVPLNLNLNRRWRAPDDRGWSECAYCFGPSLMLITWCACGRDHITGICRDCTDLAHGPGLPIRSIDPHLFRTPGTPADRCTLCGAPSAAPIHLEDPCPTNPTPRPPLTSLAPAALSPAGASTSAGSSAPPSTSPANGPR